jgi:hypothetical protein
MFTDSPRLLAITTPTGSIASFGVMPGPITTMPSCHSRSASGFDECTTILRTPTPSG